MQLTIHNMDDNTATHISGEARSIERVCRMFDNGAKHGTKFHLTITYGSIVACSLANAYAMPDTTSDSLVARVQEFCRNHKVPM
jgi:hypothetical protein